MKGYPHEWALARQQGARTHWRSLPVAFEGDGRLGSIRCVKLDEDLAAVEGSEFQLPADRVYIAIGQSRVGEIFGHLESLRVEQGLVRTDDHGFTGRVGWYAGGDCVNGGKEVVNAAAQGKTAARAIHTWFGGKNA